MPLQMRLFYAVNSLVYDVHPEGVAAESQDLSIGMFRFGVVAGGRSLVGPNECLLQWGHRSLRPQNYHALPDLA